MAVVLHQGQQLELQDLRDWCDGRDSKYKMPKQLWVVDSLPRNAIGKVTKPVGYQPLLMEFLVFNYAGDRRWS